MEKAAALRSPRVIPLGHSMLSATSTWRSTPFMPAFSILARVPQSDQYIKLLNNNKKERLHIKKRKMFFFLSKLEVLCLNELCPCANLHH